MLLAQTKRTSSRAHQHAVGRQVQHWIQRDHKDIRPRIQPDQLAGGEEEDGAGPAGGGVRTRGARHILHDQHRHPQPQSGVWGSEACAGSSVTF